MNIIHLVIKQVINFIVITVILIVVVFNSCKKNEVKHFTIEKSPFDNTSDANPFVVDTFLISPVKNNNSVRKVHVRFHLDENLIHSNFFVSWYHVYKNGADTYGVYNDNLSFNDFATIGEKYRYEITAFVSREEESKKFLIKEIVIQ